MSRPSRPKMLTPRPGVTEIDDFGDNCDDIDVEDKVQLFEGITERASSGRTDVVP